MKLKTRLCSFFSVITIIISSCLVIWGVTSYRKSSVKSSNSYLTQGITLKQKAFDEMINSLFTVLQLASNEMRIDEKDNFNYDDVLSTLKNVSTQAKPLEVYFALRNGKTFSGSRLGFIPNFDARALKREWFLGIFDKKLPRIITKPYTSSQGDYVMAMAVPIYNNGTLVGSMCMNIGVARLSKFAETIDVNKQLYLSSNEGFVFASADAKEIGKNLFELIPEFEQYNKRGTSEFDFVWKEQENAEYKVITTSLKSLDWKLWQYESYDVINADSDSFFFISIIILLITLPLSICVIYFLTKTITDPIIDCITVFGKISQEGDIGQNINSELLNKKDEIGDLAKAINDMITSLMERASVAQKIASGDLMVNPKSASEKDVLGNALVTMTKKLNHVMFQIKTASVEVDSGAKQVSSSSNSLSEGATTSAASIEEISSSMTEIESQARTSADNATQASQLATAARDAAETGAGEMGRMLEAMTGISESSQQIAKIIKVIDDIAFQTNLLALNAAVEAARAGQHGKGFAVVAEEVRSLAGRSAKAASETSELIEDAVKRVEKGNDIADQTGKALAGIVEQVTSVTDLVGEIASSSSEQALGVSQVSQGLAQIDSVTQGNTANAEETAAASKELSSQATELQNSIARFKIKNDVSAARAPHSEVKRGHVRKQIATAAKNDTWGDEPAAGSDANEQIISLDDNNFGKY